MSTTRGYSQAHQRLRANQFASRRHPTPSAKAHAEIHRLRAALSMIELYGEKWLEDPPTHARAKAVAIARAEVMLALARNGLDRKDAAA